MQKATLDEKTSTWIVNVYDQVQKREFQIRSLALVSAVGALSLPKKCDVPGHDEVQGHVFHSAKWDHSFDHTDKRILVLGKEQTPNHPMQE